MTTAQYRFERDSGVSGFLSTNRASTDAQNALGEWQEAHSERDINIVADEEEKLVAELCWAEGDDSAGRDLDVACQNHGVARTHVDS